MTQRLPNYADEGPPPDERLAAALSKLRLLVIRRDEGLVNEAAQNLAYIELLLEYPTEIAIDVIREWPRSNKFWPTWCELREGIEAEIEAIRHPNIVPFDRPIRLIVKDGCSHDFAGALQMAYQATIGRPLNHFERRTIYSQALKAASSQVDEIGLNGEVTWTVDDLPVHMKGYSNFVGRLAME